MAGQTRKENAQKKEAGAKLTDAQITEICDDLRGTCGSLNDKLEEVAGLAFDDVHRDSLEEIDSRIFHCTVCNWWCDVDEMTESEDDQICDECTDKIDGE